MDIRLTFSLLVDTWDLDGRETFRQEETDRKDCYQLTEILPYVGMGGETREHPHLTANKLCLADISI